MFRNKTKNNQNFKKLPHKKLFAFTLAEILLVFTFIGIIAAAYTVDSRAKVDTTQRKLLLYNAFNSLNVATTEIARTSDDKVVPNDGETFCQALADIFNSVGDVNCSSSLASFGVDFRTPNFVTPNGMSFYNVSAAPIADISDASKYISSTELTQIQNEAKAQANNEINTIMNALGNEAANKARASLPDRDYTVTAIYKKYEIGDSFSPTIINSSNSSNDNIGDYTIQPYNYYISFEHKGTSIPVVIEKAYENNANCYKIIIESTSNPNPVCTTIKDYTESISVESNTKYKEYADVKKIIDANYEREESNKVQQAREEATSISIKDKEYAKLYEQYYNEKFQALYTKKAASLPTVHNIYVDINGSRGKSKVNEDVFLFLVRSDGKTIPARNSELSTGTNIISAGYYKRDNTPISTNIPFKEAACKTKRFDEADYDKNYGYCAGITIDTTNCPRKTACYYKITKPKSMWSLY